MAEMDARQALIDEATELYNVFKDAAYGTPTEKFAAHTLATHIVPALIAALEHQSDRRTGFTA